MLLESTRPTARRLAVPALRTALVLLVAAVVAAAVVVQAVTDDQDVADACYLGVLVGAAIAAWCGAAQAPPGEALVPRLVACGVSLSAAADVVWAALDRWGVSTDVSVADLGWGASYLFLGTAVWVVLSRHRPAGRDHVDEAVDVLTIVVVSLLLLWGSAIQGILSDPSMSVLARVVQGSYPIVDAVLLALVLRALMRRGSRQSLGRLLAAGVCLWLAADVAYVVSPGDGVAAIVMDAAWMVGPVLMAAATWPTRSLDEDEPGRGEPLGSLPQLLVAVVPLLVPPTLEVLLDLAGRPDRPIELLISMVLLVALAFVRTARLLGSERRAHQELERTRDAALAASEAKSVFLANMGHEIRTPLTTVLAAAEMLEDTPLDATQQQLLGRMQRSGRLLGDLVERVLDFSRLAGGEVVLRPVRLDPAELVADVVEAYEDRARTQGLDLTWYVDPRTPAVVTADRVRVFQVLTNLLDNAFKFTSRGGVRLEVGPVEGCGDLVRLVVSDTGIGIRDEDQHAVFDLFTQVDDSITRAYGGSGLGLAICRQLATAMGGSITVTSRAGEGSRFELRLPVTPAAPAVARAASPV